LHDAHVLFALRVKMDAICEKPLVLNSWNVDAYRKSRKSKVAGYGTSSSCGCPDIMALKEPFAIEIGSDPGKTYDIDLTYLTGEAIERGSSSIGQSM